jgi:hypothetical protein
LKVARPGRGWIPDPDGHRTTSFGVLRARRGLASTTPSGATLRDCFPSVLDQGPTSSCTGHGTSVGIFARLAKMGQALTWIPSQSGIYTLGRCVDRADSGHGFEALRDEGAMPNQVIRGISEWGIRPMGARPSDGRMSDADPATINAEPNLLELETDALSLVVGAYEIQSRGVARVAEIRAALAAGFPVCFGMFADSAFEDWTPNKGPVGTPDLSDPNGGGHWVIFEGYSTLSNGATVFDGVNSWGRSWGDFGRFSASEDFVAGLDDITVLDISLRKAG